jgi:cytidyltransferase-like protein
MAKKVFVSGCYDLLHSGHVEFFRQAAAYGDLYVGIGSDATVLHYKNHKTLYPEQERLFMVKAIRYVKDAFINAGDGVMDFVPTVEALKPDVFVVNSDGSSEQKRKFCEERGIEYVVLQRTPAEGLKARSSTDLKAESSNIPTRLDLAGTWIDQPYVSYFAPGWALTISLLPTFEVRDRCGLSTSTRKMIQKIWPVKLPDMEPEMLAKLVFCFENDPERSDGIISGAQDAIGICVPGLARHYYNNRFWPEKIETCEDPAVLDWLENHLVMIPMEPRRPGCSVVEGKDITEPKVRALADAADRCWNAILAMDLQGFAAAYRDSFDAQVAMFPGMVRPVSTTPVPVVRQAHQPASSVPEPVEGSKGQDIPATIAQWAATPGVLAWKMPGAGGGGYLALVVDDAAAFSQHHPESIRLKIRRK